MHEVAVAAGVADVCGSGGDSVNCCDHVSRIVANSADLLHEGEGQLRLVLAQMYHHHCHLYLPHVAWYLQAVTIQYINILQLQICWT